MVFCFIDLLRMKKNARLKSIIFRASDPLGRSAEGRFHAGETRDGSMTRMNEKALKARVRPDQKKRVETLEMDGSCVGFGGTYEIPFIIL